MDLGKKLLRARLEAGLSQRQLCEGLITRNMLSQIEHDTARPSMDTLRQLAARLGKPVSWFLDENVVASPNQHQIVLARQAYAREEYETVRAALSQWQQPDDVFAWERRYLLTASTLALARRMLETGKPGYARQLLEESEAVDERFPEFRRQRLLLQAGLPGEKLTQIVSALPSLDEELLLRAEAALIEQLPERAAALLGAVDDRENARWNLLQGKVQIRQKQFAVAAEHLKKAEESCPAEAVPLLETCYREMGDYQQAYIYACKQR